MADQGIWFKLWDGWEDDVEIANLSKEDKLHWVLLGGYLKKHGNSGMACLSKPAIALQKKLMLNTYEVLMEVLKRMPGYVIEEKHNPNVTGVTVLTVTCRNWAKYQGDNSKYRVREFRRNVTLKKRREEKRREEKRITPPIVPQGGPSKVLDWFERTWLAYPKERRVGKKAAFRSYQREVKTLDDAKAVARAVENYLKSETVRNGYIKNASTFFSNWRDYADDDPRNSERISSADVEQGRNSEGARTGGFVRTGDAMPGAAADIAPVGKDAPPDDSLNPGD